MSKKFKSPYELVASELKVSVDSLDEESSMGVQPCWDSLNHLGIIVAIESNYRIQIPNNEILKYTNMKAIIELYESLKHTNKS